MTNKLWPGNDVNLAEVVEKQNAQIAQLMAIVQGMVKTQVQPIAQPKVTTQVAKAEYEQFVPREHGNVLLGLVETSPAGLAAAKKRFQAAQYGLVLPSSMSLKDATREIFNARAKGALPKWPKTISKGVYAPADASSDKPKRKYERKAQAKAATAQAVVSDSAFKQALALILSKLG